MKKFAKLTALVLAIVMAFTMLPVMTYAEEAAETVETAEAVAAEPAETTEEAPAAQPVEEQPVLETADKTEEIVAAAIEAADDEAAVAAGAYWSYTTESGDTTYYAELVGDNGAYTQGLALDDAASDETAGVMKLLQDWKIDNNTPVMSSTYGVLYNPTKAINIDLNGHTITNSRSTSSTYLLYFTSPAAVVWNIHIFSSTEKGAYVNTTTGTRGCIGLGASSVNVKYSANVKLENFSAHNSAGAVLISNVANLTLDIEDCDFVVDQTQPVMAIQMSTGAVVGTPASAILSMKNVSLSGKYGVYWINGASKTNRSADYTYSLTLDGTNSITCDTSDTAASYHGMRVRLFDEEGNRDYYDWTDFATVAPGSVIEITGPVVSGTKQTTTAEVIPGIDVSWDTDGDGTVDEVTTEARNAHPTHEDGSKPYNAAQQKVYTFAGWSDGTTTYAPGEELPLPTQVTSYTAVFTEETVTEFYHISFVDEDETILYEIAEHPYVLAVEYPYDDPVKETNETGIYEFVGWSDGTTTYATADLPIPTGDTTYTAVYNTVGVPVTKYTSVAGETTFFTNLYDAYAASASDPDATPTDGGVITLLKDITLSEDGGTPLATIAGGSAAAFYMVIWKEQTNALNLNFAGHTIVNDVNKHFVTVFSTVAKGANPNSTIHMYSTDENGELLEGAKYIFPSTNANGRSFIKYCENSASTCLTSSVVMAPKAVVEDLYVESQSTGSLFSSFFISGYMKFYRCTIVGWENTANSIASMQITSSTASVGTNWVNTDVTFEDCEILSGGLIMYYTNIFYGTSTRHDSYAPTLTISGGRTTLYYPTSSSRADQYNLVSNDNVYPGSNTKSILDTPIAITDSDDTAIVIESVEEGQSYTYDAYGQEGVTRTDLTKVVLLPGYKVSWDTDGDGTVDDATAHLPSEHPTHDDGERPFDPNTKTFYTFTGWTDGTTTYAPGEELPVVDAPVTYTAVFSSTKDESVIAAWTAQDGTVNTCSDVEQLAAFIAEANTNEAAKFDLLCDMELAEDLTLSGVAFFDAHNHALTGTHSLVITGDTTLSNATINVDADPAVSVQSGLFMLIESTIKSTGVGVAVAANVDPVTLNTVKIYAGSSREEDIPAVHGAAGSTVYFESCLVVTGSVAPALATEGEMYLNDTEAYVSGTYYAENKAWSTGAVNSNMLSVSRGTFTVPTTTWTGYKRISADSPVAMIGSTGYETLYAAFKAMQKGDTITLLQDTVPEDEMRAWEEDPNHRLGLSNNLPNNFTWYYVNKTDVTFDLNGHTVYCPGQYQYNDGSATYTLNGRMLIIASSKAVLTIKNGTIDATAQKASANYCLMLSAANVTLNLVNVKQIAALRGVWIGTSQKGCTINFYGGEFYSTSTGSEGYRLATAEGYGPNAFNLYDGVKFIKNRAGGAIQVARFADTCYIESAEFYSGNGTTGYEVVNGTEDAFVLADGVQKTVSTDTYDGKSYTVVKYEKAASDSDAKVGSEVFENFDDAVTAAETANETVVLMRDVTKTDPTTIPENVKVDTNGFELTLPAGSQINGVTLTDTMKLDSSLSLKKASLTLLDPITLNLKFARPDINVTLKTGSDTVQPDVTESSNSLYAYKFPMAKTDYTTEYTVYATDGVKYGIPTKVSVLKYAQTAAAGNDAKLTALAAALMYYADPTATYDGLTKVTTLDQFTAAAGDSYLVVNEDDLGVIYDGAQGAFDVTYTDVYGKAQTISVNGMESFDIPIANIMKDLTISKEGAESETDTLMNALKTGGDSYIYTAIYGYCAAQFFGG